MAKDSQGMDLGQVEALVTAAIMIVPYSSENRITPEMIAPSKATTELPAAYNRSTACIGLVKSDGGNQDSRDGDDPLEFLQDGYKKLPLATSLTQTFSPAENNALTRKITIGEPDSNGVYHVADIIQDAKWMGVRGGDVRHRACPSSCRRHAGHRQRAGPAGAWLGHRPRAHRRMDEGSAVCGCGASEHALD